MGEVTVHVLGGYVASQCKIYEMYAHTIYFFILEYLNVCSKRSIGFRQTWWVAVHDNQPFIKFNLVISIIQIVKYFILALELYLNELSWNKNRFLSK